MASSATVARSIRAFRDAALSPEALSRNLAAIARQARDDLIARGDAPHSYQTWVDGREGAQEETVRPTGAILYKFNLLGQAAALAIQECIARSPAKSGAYRRAWFVAVDGQKWTRDLADIPQGATVWVTNPLPYARKIDAGHMRMRVPPGIVEAVRQVVRRRFPTVDAQRIFVNIPASLGGGYVLRGRFRRGKRQFARTKLRADTAEGAIMTYPALALTSRL